MRITDLLTDEALLAELGERFAHSRLNQNVTQAELAKEAGVSKRTVERIEAGASTQLSNLVRVIRALDLLGNFELLVPELPPSPLAQWKLRSKERLRASATPKRFTGSGGSGSSGGSGAWEWGEES